MTKTDQLKKELIDDLIQWTEEALNIKLSRMQKKVLGLIVEKDTQFFQAMSEARMKHERSTGKETERTDTT